ncbi:MAG: hypothetical protein KY444_10325, partial [Gemmatimonadetes bacterium]|nr:hypothetical protein [Gemmatimonadota bacterium]
LWATSDTLRVAEGSGPILRGIYALLLPYPLVRAGHPLLWGTADVERMGHMYYAGTVFTAAGLFGMALLFVALVRRRVPWRPLLGGNPWLCCAAVALVLSLGSYGGLWLLLRALPGFSRFNFAFKFLPLLTLLLVLGGAVLLERLVSARHRPRRWGAGLAAATVALLAYHVGQARPSFFTFGAAPYPRPPADIGRLLAAPGTGAGRLWPLAPERSTDPSYPQVMRLNLATVHGLHAVFGYDPLVGATPVWEAAATRLGVTPVEAARAYGVRWVLVHRTVYQPVFGPNPEQAWLERFSDAEMERLSRLLDGATRRTASGGIELWEIAQPAPLVFDSASGVPITSAWAPQDLVVRPGAMREPRAVVINLLHRRGFRATADGRPLALRADSWGRMVATLPAGTSRVEVDYRAPWHVGIWAALAVAAIAVAVGAWLTRGTRGLRP